jgi:hypothetical protein
MHVFSIFKFNKYFIIFFFVYFSTFTITSFSVAADYHYIRANANDGANNGSDWNNAYTSLPSSLIRGDTYFIADGTYGSYKFDDAVSGPLTITIQKATISEHGTDDGWDDSYGDGQAIFQRTTGSIVPTIDIVTSNIVFDGAVGSGSDPSNYGFYISKPADNCASPQRVGFGMPGAGYTGINIANITVSHTAIIGCGNTEPICSDGVYSYPNSVSNITFTYNYIIGFQTNLHHLNWNTATIAYNYFGYNWSGANCHGQQISCKYTKDIEFHNNTLKDSYVFVMGAHNARNERWNIYNNLVLGGNAGIWCHAAIGGNPDDDVILDWKIHHNTHVNVQVGSWGAVAVGPVSDISNHKTRVYNNLFYNCNSPKMSNTDCADCSAQAIEHLNNAFYKTSGIFDNYEEGTAVTSSADPFVDSDKGDYRLKPGVSAINAGIQLGSPFDTDFRGMQRGKGGGWDIGAFEHIAPPSSLQLK